MAAAVPHQTVGEPYAVTTRWHGLGPADEGAALIARAVAAGSVQAYGAFDGGALVVEGSNDHGVTWAELLRFSEPGIRPLPALPGQLRPRVEGGGSRTVLHAAVVLRQ